MSIESFFAKIVKDVEELFSIHSDQINNAISEAQAALSTAGSIATILNEPPSVASVLSKVSDGLSAIQTAVAAEATASTLNAQVTAATTLVNTLTNSGDIGVKNNQTKSAINSAANKVSSVANVLQSAAATVSSLPVSSVNASIVS